MESHCAHVTHDNERKPTTTESRFGSLLLWAHFPFFVESEKDNAVNISLRRNVKVVLHSRVFSQLDLLVPSGMYLDLKSKKQNQNLGEGWSKRMRFTSQWRSAGRKGGGGGGGEALLCGVLLCSEGESSLLPVSLRQECFPEKWWMSVQVPEKWWIRLSLLPCDRSHGAFLCCCSCGGPASFANYSATNPLESSIVARKGVVWPWHRVARSLPARFLIIEWLYQRCLDLWLWGDHTLTKITVLLLRKLFFQMFRPFSIWRNKLLIFGNSHLHFVEGKLVAAL